MTYSAPTEHMTFVLDSVARLDDLANMPAFSEAGLDAIPYLLNEAGRFFSQVIAPTNRDGDIEGCTWHEDGSVSTPSSFAHAYAEYCASGWGSISFDPTYGGGGMPWVIGVAIQEMLSASNMALSLNPMLTQGAIHTIHEHGTEQQKLTWLPKLVSGEWTGTMNLTESHAGTDVGSVTTLATPQPDNTWRITGQKIFITWGEHDLTDNIVHLVLARTPNSAAGAKGLSLFIVPKLLLQAGGSSGEPNEVRCLSIEHKLGIHGSPTAVMQFGGSNGAVGYLLGKEHQGMACMFTMMNQARLSVGLEGLAIADRSYQEALAFAAERKQGRRSGTPSGHSVSIIEHPDVRRMLATIRTSVEAMRCLIYFNAVSIDRSRHATDLSQRLHHQKLADLLTPISKAWCTDMGVEMSSLALQIHGGAGYIEETGVAQHFRDIRIGPIYEGTNGIQAIDLAIRKVAADNGRSAHLLIAEMRQTVNNLANFGLDILSAPLLSAIVTLEEATTFIVERSQDQPDDVLAGATPYLRIFATTVGGWLLAKSACVEHSGEHTKGEKPRTAVATFYCQQTLPSVHGLFDSVVAGFQSIYAVPIDHS